MRLSALAAYARTLGCTAEEQVSMIDYTSFKIGGPADVYITAPTEAAAAAALIRCREEDIPVYLLGNGTNLLVGDKGLRGAVIRLDGRQAAPTLQPDGRTVQCSAGVSLKRLCQYARDKALTGLEFAFGIPGAVGGAVYMNAGAYGGQMDQVLVSATGLSRTGKRHTFAADRLNLGYRHSVFMDEGDMVVSATLRLTPGDPAEIAARMEELLRRRRDKQPLEYPSAGSFFKRPPGHFAGALIEGCGLKGFAVGGAQVREKHAGFVLNRGGATAQDVLRLCDAVQERVFREQGVQLEPEVRFIGEF